jgi:hypothetical protein
MAPSRRPPKAVGVIIPNMVGAISRPQEHPDPRSNQQQIKQPASVHSGAGNQQQQTPKAGRQFAVNTDQASLTADPALRSVPG